MNLRCKLFKFASLDESYLPIAKTRRLNLAFAFVAFALVAFALVAFALVAFVLVAFAPAPF